MQKKTKILLLLVLLATYISISYAIQTLTFYQNPKVPPGSYAVYQADGITQITPASNQTSIWQWDQLHSSFNATILIKNTGSTTINATVTIAGLDPAWTPHGEGSYLILALATRQVKLSIVNPNPIAGEYVGQFSVSVSA